MQERDEVRAAAMALFGDLVVSVAGQQLGSLRTQVQQTMVPLLLHLKDHCPTVVTVSARVRPSPGGAGAPRWAGGC